MEDKYCGGYLISMIHRTSNRVFNRLLKEHDILLNSAQGRILFILWETDRIPISELADKTGLKKSTLTSMLDRLEEKGFVAREHSPRDRRTILISRTDKDRALQEEYDRISRLMTDIFYSGIDKKNIREFEKTLEKILENLREAECN